MLKRIVAAVFGFLSGCAGLVLFGKTIEIAEEVRWSFDPLWMNLLGLFLICFVALTASILAMKLLRFAFSGRIASERSRLYSVFLGVACVIPGFFFSLPIAFWMAFHTRLGARNPDLVALTVSCSFAVLSAVAGCFVLLRKGATQAKASAPGEGGPFSN